MEENRAARLVWAMLGFNTACLIVNLIVWSSPIRPARQSDEWYAGVARELAAPPPETDSLGYQYIDMDTGEFVTLAEARARGWTKR